jgi:uncharacterized NAD(P)/FAD-binding protein YdhS
MSCSLVETSDVAIVGGGFSGVAIAVHLQKECLKTSSSLKALMFEPRETIGSGLAYGTTSPVHILNVPAAKMGIDEQEPSAFYSWLLEQSYNYTAADFVPRCLYQEYLSFELHSSLTISPNNMQLKRVRASVSEISLLKNNCYLLRTENNEEFVAKSVIVATGNAPVINSVRPSIEASLLDPFDKEVISRAANSNSVAVVGTGLTAIDTVLALEAAGFQGSYTLVSRKGQLPQPHTNNSAAVPIDQSLIDRLKTTSSLRILLANFRSAAKTGTDWHSLLDALRPFSQGIWGGLELKEKRRFLKYLRPYWDSHRHRVPAANFGAIQDLRNQGRLKILRGRILSAEVINEKTWLRSSVMNHQLLGPFDHCFNCMGVWSNLSNCDSSLIKSLISHGLASFDDLFLGLRATSSGELIDAQNQIVPGLFTLGSLRRGELWETTAVRELRQQASSIAKVIADRCAINRSVGDVAPLVANN